MGCFPLCQRFRKFRSEFKWKGPFCFLPTGIFGITSGSDPLTSVGISDRNSLINWFFALIRGFETGIKKGKNHSYRLARFYRKTSFRFRRVFPLTLTCRFSSVMESTPGGSRFCALQRVTHISWPVSRASIIERFKFNTSDEFKNATNNRSFWNCARGNLRQGNHLFIVTPKSRPRSHSSRHSFSLKSSVFNMFSMHTRTKTRRFQISAFS